MFYLFQKVKMTSTSIQKNTITDAIASYNILESKYTKLKDKLDRQAEDINIIYNAQKDNIHEVYDKYQQELQKNVIRIDKLVYIINSQNECLSHLKKIEHKLWESILPKSSENISTSVQIYLESNDGPIEEMQLNDKSQHELEAELSKFKEAVQKLKEEILNHSITQESTLTHLQESIKLVNKYNDKASKYNLILERMPREESNSARVLPTKLRLKKTCNHTYEIQGLIRTLVVNYSKSQKSALAWEPNTQETDIFGVSRKEIEHHQKDSIFAASIDFLNTRKRKIDDLQTQYNNSAMGDQSIRNQAMLQALQHAQNALYLETSQKKKVKIAWFIENIKKNLSQPTGVTRQITQLHVIPFNTHYEALSNPLASRLARPIILQSSDYSATNHN